MILAHQIGQNDIEWQEVSRRVQQDPSMGKPWEIWDICLIDVVLLRRPKKILMYLLIFKDEALMKNNNQISNGLLQTYSSIVILIDQLAECFQSLQQ